jgi:hypothetical protein
METFSYEVLDMMLSGLDPDEDCNENPDEDTQSVQAPIARDAPVYVKSNLPDQALVVLKAWYFDPLHVSHPYPSKSEKDELLMKTGLDRKQLDTWFCNARRRFHKTLTANPVQPTTEHLEAEEVKHRKRRERNKQAVSEHATQLRVINLLNFTQTIGVQDEKEEAP